MRTSFALLIAVSLLVAALPAPALASRAADAAVTDPTPDAQYPTSNQQLLVPSGGVGMNALFLLASGEAPKPTLVLMHGLPGNERNLDLAQAVRRAGWNVLTFTYRGAWGSPGEFSIANALEDAGAAVAFVQRPEVAAKYRVDPRRIVLGGHSMGGFASARYAAAHDDIAGLLLIDAWNAGADAAAERAKGDHAALVAGFDDLGHSLVGADAESLALEIENSPADWDLVTLAPKLAPHRTFVVWADNGNAPQNEALVASMRRAGAKSLGTVHFPSDHSFSDHRIALSRAVIGWLDTLR